MDINYYKQYEPIFGSWHITRLIGEGSFGKVFEMEREDFGITYKAALKAITIPNNQSEVDDLLTEMTNVDSVKTYYSSFVKELVEESALMSKLKGNSNVVSYEDHQVIEHKEGVGWDILIRMELLTPLNRYIKEHTITRQDIIKLGIDMCKALELCQKYNIIHRDLKPENIFISDSGDFKLGDFGIARTIEKTTGGLSKKGTYNYMAPEVYKGQAYGSTVDIYSLGVVLYRLLNENRTPFLPAYPAPITYKDRDNALAKRFSGAPLPRPANGDGRLGEIVLKACAYEPKDRYSSPTQMRQELEAILYNKEEAPYIYPEGDQVEQKSVEYIQTGNEPLVTVEEATQRDATQTEVAVEQTVSDFGTIRAERMEQPAGDTGPVQSNDVSQAEKGAWPDRNLYTSVETVQQESQTPLLQKDINWPIVFTAMVTSIFVTIVMAAANMLQIYRSFYIMRLSFYSWAGAVTGGLLAGFLIYVCIYHSRRTAIYVLPSLLLGKLLGYYLSCVRVMEIMKEFTVFIALSILPYCVCLGAVVLFSGKIQTKPKMLCLTLGCYIATFILLIFSFMP